MPGRPRERMAGLPERAAVLAVACATSPASVLHTSQGACVREGHRGLCWDGLEGEACGPGSAAGMHRSVQPLSGAEGQGSGDRTETRSGTGRTAVSTGSRSAPQCGAGWAGSTARGRQAQRNAVSAALGDRRRVFCAHSVDGLRPSCWGARSCHGLHEPPPGRSDAAASAEKRVRRRPSPHARPARPAFGLSVSGVIGSMGIQVCPAGSWQ